MSIPLPLAVLPGSLGPQFWERKGSRVVQAHPPDGSLYPGLADDWVTRSQVYVFGAPATCATKAFSAADVTVPRWPPLAVASSCASAKLLGVTTNSYEWPLVGQTTRG